VNEGKFMQSTTELARFAKIVLLGGLLLSSVHTCRADGYLIKYKYVVGKTVRYSTSTDMNTSMSLNGQPMNIVLHMDAVMRQTVKSVSPVDGTATVASTYHLTGETSKGNPVPIPASLMVPQTSTLTIKPSGEVINSASTNQSGLGGGMAGMQNFQGSALLPDKPVNIGDTWTTSFNIPMYAMSFTMTSTLKAVASLNGDNIAEITSSMVPGSENPSAATGGSSNSMISAMHLQIQSMSDTFFDIDAGVLKSTTTNMTTDTAATSRPGMPAMPPIHSLTVIKMNELPAPGN
jgi:hypothetical protein